MRLLFILMLFPIFVFSEIVPRKVIAFWDSKVDKVVDNSVVLQTLEMPLNVLGLDVEYYDIQEKLPKIVNREDVLGILVAFQETTKMKNPKKFIEWTIDAIDHGKKVLLMRNVGFLADLKGNFTSLNIQNKLYEKLGFISSQDFIEYTFDYKVLWKSDKFFPFEKDYPNRLNGFSRTIVYDENAKSYLKIGIPNKKETESDMIIIHPNGGYAANLYANNYDTEIMGENSRALGWYLDPFKFFKKAFQIQNFPIPDVTTLAGRRILFSTCHADGWNETCTIEKYRKKNETVARAFLEEIIRPNPDIPLSVAIIAADIDPDWVGTKKSQEITREYFKMPQVEAASHTYSHPFDWEFFRENANEKEMHFLHKYPYGAWQNSFYSWFRSKMYQTFSPKEMNYAKLSWDFEIPRAYANKPFNVKNEIIGSIDYINDFAPPDNKVNLLIWPGDSRPWYEPLYLTKKAKVQNFGGGFVRFDQEYPSYLYVYPIARKLNGLVQLYETAAAENVYTEGWSKHFFGYKHVIPTFENTEHPKRIKPILLYYHTYGAQFQASVDAMKTVIKYTRTQRLLHMKNTRYCELGEGFFTAKIEKLSQGKWLIKNREGLHTFRFPSADKFRVDFANSKGVLGFIEHQNSIYIYLDAASHEPVIAIKKKEKGIRDNDLYLIDSSWEIWDFVQKKSSFSFFAKGWGKLVMRWRVKKTGEYLISSPSLEKNVLVKTKNNILDIELDLPFDSEIRINIGKT